MGSPLSPVLACMVMEVIEQNAIETFFKPPSIWVRYVNDVYSVVETNQIALFRGHLNTISSSIKFTKELESEGTLSFLDVAVIRKTDGTPSTDIYRKPTHTGRYLSFSSHHPLNQCFSSLFSPRPKIHLFFAKMAFVAHTQFGIILML